MTADGVLAHYGMSGVSSHRRRSTNSAWPCTVRGRAQSQLMKTPSTGPVVSLHEQGEPVPWPGTAVTVH